MSSYSVQHAYGYYIQSLLLYQFPMAGSLQLPNHARELFRLAQCCTPRFPGIVSRIVSRSHTAIFTIPGGAYNASDLEVDPARK